MSGRPNVSPLSGHLSVSEMERIRDDNLIALIRALKSGGWGAGEALARYEAAQSVRATASESRAGATSRLS